MSDNDVLVDLLGHPEIKMPRKPESVFGRSNGDGDHNGGYDLTNPNLHHGVEDTYRPFHSSEQPKSNGFVKTDATPVAVNERVDLNAGDAGSSAAAIANQTAAEGQPFSLDISSHFAASAAGEALSFAANMPAGLRIDAHTGIISGVPTDSDFGDHPITVTATDTNGVAVSETFQLQVDDSGPTATAIANQSAYEGHAFSFDVSGYFKAPAAGDALRFSGTMPAGLTIDARTGVISGVPTDSDFGSNTITVTATDAHGKAISETFQLQVSDSGPTTSAIASQTAYEGHAFSLDISSHFAAPAAGDTLTFSGTMPAGLSIDAHTGVISGVPTDSDFGNNTIAVTATDAHGMAISETFNFRADDSGPTASAIANQGAYVGQAFSLDISSYFAVPAAGDTLTFSATMPAGLKIDAHTGIISGVPTDSDFGNNTIAVTATDAHGETVSETFQLQVDDGGPTATAIANQSAHEGQAFLLNVASHFKAPAAGDMLTFSAAMPTGLSIDAHTGVISGVPTDSDFGNNTITVTATDAHGKAVSENFQLQVDDSGPTATAVTNQSAHEGQAFSFNVAGYFKAPAAGDTLTFSATMPAGLGIDAHTGVISGVPTDSDFGNNTITVTATDAHGKAVSETFQLQVDDSGPTATAVANQSAHEGQAFSFNVASHFKAPAAGDTLTFSATMPAGLSIDAHTGVISGVPTDSDFGNNPITVTATDAHGKAISESFQLQVSDSGPTATAIANQSAFEGKAFSLDISSHFVAPAVGDTLTFSGTMPAGLSIDAHTGVISGVPTDSDFGNHSITVIATDAHGKTISESFHLQVGDSGPTATAITDQISSEGQAFSLDVSSHFVAPAAGDALVFSGTMPTGLKIDAHTGVISGVPTDSDFGNHTITVTATDAHGEAISESFDLQVGDSGPTAMAIANQSAFEGKTFSFNISSHFAAPAAGDALTFSGTMPAGLSLNAHTGVISGVPTDSDFGNNTITATATDAHGMAISETFQLQVGDSGPTATAIADQSSFEGKAFSLNVSSHFKAPATGDTLVFSGTMPAGLQIDAHTGVISGVPTDSDFGDNTITVTSTDAHGMAISETFKLQVGDSGPTATAIANQTAYEGQAYSLNVASHFKAPAAGDTLTFSGAMPAGLSIDAHTGIVSGVPTDSDFGNNTIAVTATDAHGMAISETFRLEVGDKGPTGTAIANQTAYEGQAFSLDLSSHFVAPAAGDTLTFSGTMPAGLTIDSHTGVISGLPTDSDFGNHSITVTATDAHGKAVSESFHLQVSDSGPTATTIESQSAYEGQAYSVDISGHFAAPAADDSLTFSGKMPDGLQIDAHTGVISGVPTDGDFGNHSITVTATDAHGKTISETFQLQVGDSGPTATTIANQSSSEGHTLSLDVSSHFVAPAAGDTLTFSGAMPAGLQIDAHTGVISGVPTDSDFTSSAHEYNFNFTSFDGNFTITGQLTTSQSLDSSGGFDVTGITGSVVGPDGSVISSLIDNPTHSYGSISPDGVWIYDNILYAGSSTLLDYGGVLFTSNNYEYNIFYNNGQYLLETLNPQGILNPGEAGTFTISEVPTDQPITVTATDAHGMAVSETFHLQVGDSGPTATAIADQSAYQGQNVSLDVSSHFVAPAAGDTLTFSASLPTGLSIDAHSGIISGVPTQGDLGNNPITVTATDAHGMTATESFHLEVGDTNHVFFLSTHNGDASINGSPSWTDTVDLHNIGQSASFNVVELAADGHTVHSWTGLVTSGSAQSDHDLTLAQGDHALITINHTDGSSADHIALQNISHIKY